MSPLDIVRAPDGSMSLTKLAASTGYFLASVMFMRLQWNAPFNLDLWGVYLGTTVLHATIDKTAAMVKDFKEQKLDAAEAAKESP